MPAKRKRQRAAQSRWRNTGGFRPVSARVSNSRDSDTDSDIEYVPARKEPRVGTHEEAASTVLGSHESEGNEFLINLSEDEAGAPDFEFEEEGYPSPLSALDVLMSFRLIHGEGKGPGKAPHHGTSRWSAWRQAREAGKKAQTVADCLPLAHYFGGAPLMPPKLSHSTGDVRDNDVVSLFHFKWNDKTNAYLLTAFRCKLGLELGLGLGHGLTLTLTLALALALALGCGR